MKARIDFPGTETGRERLVFDAPLAQLVALSLDEVPSVLDRAQAAALAGNWVVGWLAYEAAPAFDKVFAVRPSMDNWPLAVFAIYESPGTDFMPKADDFTCGDWQMAMPKERVLSAIQEIRQGIAAGDFYQVNLTAPLVTEVSGSSSALFASLHEAQPDGYCIHLADTDWEILSVSPELFFDWQNGVLKTRPMKGTAPRHADPLADAAAAQALRASAKDRAENLMIVDLLRNDLAPVAVIGSVEVPALFELDALPSAWQMSSRVQCRTLPETTLSEVFGTLFPCGSITGAPKVAAMAAIARLEMGPRGPYCGALGLIRPGGHATFNVGIRTLMLDRASHSTGGKAICGLGSGITYDSKAADEYAEWLVKRRFLLRACANFELLETLALEDGRYFLLERHLARMLASAAHFGFLCEAESLQKELAALAKRHPAGQWRVRLLCNRRGELRIEIFTLEPMAQDGLMVGLARVPIAGDEEFLLHKTTKRTAYQPFVPVAGLFDSLLWNSKGELTEFTRGNLVVEIEGAEVTPPVRCGLLPGVLRAELLASGAVTERVIRLEELPKAKRLWFINSVRGRLEVQIEV